MNVIILINLSKIKILKITIIYTFGNSWSIAFLTYYFYLKPIMRELVNNMSPYYPIQFEKLFRKIFQTNNTIMIAISKNYRSYVKYIM